MVMFSGVRISHGETIVHAMCHSIKMYMYTHVNTKRVLIWVFFYGYRYFVDGSFMQ